jgi:hypothetical protein
MIGHGTQATGGIPSHHGVVAPQRGRDCRGSGGGPLELLLGHVGGVELGTGWPLTYSGHERPVAVEPVPGPVVDQDVAAEVGVGDRGQQRVPEGVDLLPVDCVHHPGGIDQERQHPALLVGQRGEVGRERDGRVLGQLRGEAGRGAGAGRSLARSWAGARHETQSCPRRRRPPEPTAHETLRVRIAALTPGRCGPRRLSRSAGPR